MAALIKTFHRNDGNIAVDGRDLHDFLDIETPYRKWFPRMLEYGFNENKDFVTFGQKSPIANGGYKNIENHALTLSMAKELSMIQRTERGKQARQYFIRMEEQAKQIGKFTIPNSLPEALRLAADQAEQIEIMKPKAIFADAVSVSHTAILVGELAKLLRQNGIDIGQNRLFAWLRRNGYLINRKGTDWNQPTQRSADMGLFKVKETTINHPDGSVSISKTVKVTGKGQQYFINKLLQGATK
ncbi:phage antirepressor KilAC domain-containing protein [Loigolactobacillus rennini]|uniref:Phage-encoded protein n=1 Tax=Loigolactobacillus rennini DSM 20253 TaxID=1423796 RepID=A0A0R2CNU4_9LACO|nr:phage antirepressor KilAC domain-containing protein [Loigolactobacillus rennini]KRM92890.1 phage-encoded protein [Loigolactobacillus rennini DSM 20253]